MQSYYIISFLVIISNTQTGDNTGLGIKDVHIVTGILEITGAASKKYTSVIFSNGKMMTKGSQPAHLKLLDTKSRLQKKLAAKK